MTSFAATVRPRRRGEDREAKLRVIVYMRFPIHIHWRAMPSGRADATVSLGR